MAVWCTLKNPPPLISSEGIFMSHIAQYIILAIFKLPRASHMTLDMCIRRYLWNRFFETFKFDIRRIR